MDYARKTILFVLTSVLGTNLVALALSGKWNSDSWWTLGITIVGAVIVFLKQNTPTDPEAKYWIALFVPVLLGVQAAISDSQFTAEEVSPILIALIGAFQVRAAGNVPPSVPEEEFEPDEAY